MKRCVDRLRFILFSLVVAGAGGPLRAQVPMFEVSTDTSASFLPSCSQARSGSVGQTTSCDTTFYARVSQAQASAQAGTLRVDALASADAPNANLGAVFAFSRASASLTDHLTWVGPASTRVTLTGLVGVHGGVVADTWGSAFSGLSQADYTVTGGLFGKGFVRSGTWQDFASNPAVIRDPNPNLLIPLTVTLDFDASGRSTQGSFQLALTVSANANARGTSDPATGLFLPGHSQASATFGNTIYWAGVTSVVDSFGNPVAGVRSISASGFDYTASAVPEPGAATLTSLGLLVLALHYRRVHRRSGRDGVSA